MKCKVFILFSAIKNEIKLKIIQTIYAVKCYRQRKTYFLIGLSSCDGSLIVLIRTRYETYVQVATQTKRARAILIITFNELGPAPLIKGPV